jgi:NitT/TauT family transport system ATP-binding protein
LVTHDIGEAIAMSDRVLVLSQRPGTVKAIHDIELGDATDPGTLRRSPAFNEYFDTIWRQLDGHAQAAV